MLTEQGLASTAVEALAAELRVVGNNTVADVEALDVLAHGGNNTNGFVAYQSSTPIIETDSLVEMPRTYQELEGTIRSEMSASSSY